jgi:hypothetical protein
MARCLTALLAAVLACSAWCAAPPSGLANPGEVEMPREVLASIQLAQRWLASRQRADGSFSDRYGEGAGIVASGVLAWMVSGSTPGAGPYGGPVALGVDYVLSCAQPSGLLYSGRNEQHAMYQHGLATLCLAEAYGQTLDRRIYEKLKAAVELCVRCQNELGGWRYQPRIDPTGDLSVTVMILLGLRAARDAGIALPKETIQRAVHYLELCRDREGGPDAIAGFCYQPGRGRKWSTTAAGLMSLMLCGQYRAERYKGALDYLLSVRLRNEDREWFIYGNYYAAQALYQAGARGEAYRDCWPKWYRSMSQELLKRQVKSGADRGRFEVDREYGIWGTAMSVLILGLPYRYLPIYQR